MMPVKTNEVSHPGDRHKTFDDAWDAYHVKGAGIVEVNTILGRAKSFDLEVRRVILWTILEWKDEDEKT